MAEWILNVLSSGGYLGLAALAALECVFPPLPSELIFPLAGYLAQRGDLSLTGCVLAGALGGCVGSLPLFAVGRRLGPERVEAFVVRHCRWAAVSDNDVKRAAKWFQRHGTRAVVLAHFVPGLRSLIAFPAGISRMSMWRFGLLTFAGAGAWTSLLVGLGFVLRDNFAGIDQWLDPIAWLVIGAATLTYAIRLRRQRHRIDGGPA
jgi:membrane protein DedA with SNARE-associated domain